MLALKDRFFQQSNSPATRSETSGDLVSGPIPKPFPEHVKQADTLVLPERTRLAERTHQDANHYVIEPKLEISEKLPVETYRDIEKGRHPTIVRTRSQKLILSYASQKAAYYCPQLQVVSLWAAGYGTLLLPNYISIPISALSVSVGTYAEISYRACKAESKRQDNFRDMYGYRENALD